MSSEDTISSSPCTSATGRAAGRRRRRRSLDTCAAVLAMITLLSACDDSSDAGQATSDAVLDGDTTPAASDSGPGSVVDTEEVSVAETYMSALAGLDLEALRSITSDSTFSAAYGNSPELVSGWWAATGFELVPGQCQPADRPNVVTCDYEYHGLRSNELGKGPYGGNHAELTVEGGHVVSIVDQIEFGTNGFSEQIWEPFAAWIQATHPDDVEAMYVPGFGDAVMTEESIALWKTRTSEYAAEQQ